MHDMKLCIFAFKEAASFGDAESGSYVCAHKRPARGNRVSGGPRAEHSIFVLHTRKIQFQVHKHM